MPVPISPQDRLGIERVAVRAWPALETSNVSGWLWRYTGGGSQRANSVSPLDFFGADVEAAIAAAEQLYGARGATPMFRQDREVGIVREGDRGVETERLGEGVAEGLVTPAQVRGHRHHAVAPADDADDGDAHADDAVL